MKTVRSLDILLLLLPAILLPAILLFAFGFFAKTTEEYACTLQMARQSPQVAAVTGEPLTPGLFAWMPYFESGGGLRQGAFFTKLSGPAGRGTLRAEFYRAPIGATLYITFKSGGEEKVIYDGAYPCP
ncbi:MAG: hypothetical protein Fur0043_05110 [Anaerolineales bacterium]